MLDFVEVNTKKTGTTLEACSKVVPVSISLADEPPGQLPPDLGSGRKLLPVPVPAVTSLALHWQLTVNPLTWYVLPEIKRPTYLPDLLHPSVARPSYCGRPAAFRPCLAAGLAFSGVLLVIFRLPPIDDLSSHLLGGVPHFLSRDSLLGKTITMPKQRHPRDDGLSLQGQNIHAVPSPVCKIQSRKTNLLAPRS